MPTSLSHNYGGQSIDKQTVISYNTNGMSETNPLENIKQGARDVFFPGFYHFSLPHILALSSIIKASRIREPDLKGKFGLALEQAEPEVVEPIFADGTFDINSLGQSVIKLQCLEIASQTAGFLGRELTDEQYESVLNQSGAEYRKVPKAVYSLFYK